MKLVHIKNFTGEDLRARQFLCYLPTEIVIPCPYTGKMEYDLDRVFAYRLPRKKFPVWQHNGKFEDGKRFQAWYDQIAIEWHTDCGDDGHTRYKLQNYYIVVYENEIDLSNITFDAYKVLSDRAYDLNEIRLNQEQQQLTFNHVASPYSYESLWT